MSGENCFTVTKNPELTKICLHNPGRLFLVLFYSPAHEASLNLKKMMESLAKFQQDPLYIFIDVTVFPQGATNMQINIVPSVFFTDSTKKKFHLLENPAPHDLNENIEVYVPKYKQNFEIERKRIFSRIERILTKEISPLHVFIKGTPEAPECGYTSQMLDILKKFDVSFSFFNILLDEELRDWLRLYSNWKTYPQLYINGKIVGGLDVLRGLVDDGKFEAMIPEEAKRHNPEQRETRLLKSAKILLFTEGDSHEPSNLLIKILRETGVKFSMFQLNSDPELHKYMLAKYPTVAAPLIFVESKLLGGSKEVEDLFNKKSLLEKLPSSEWRLNAEQKLEFLLAKFSLVLFLRGNLDSLEDELSKKIVSTLSEKQVPFQYFNVSADSEVEKLVCSVSGVDEFPQVFQNGKYVPNKEFC